MKFLPTLFSIITISITPFTWGADRRASEGYIQVKGNLSVDPRAQNVRNNADEIDWSLPISKIKEQIKDLENRKEADIKHRPFKFLSYPSSIILKPYSEVHESKNEFRSSNLHSNEVSHLRTDKCKPLEFFLVENGNRKVNLRDSRHLILITEFGYSTLIKRELTDDDISDHWSGSIFMELFFWAFFKGAPGGFGNDNVGRMGSHPTEYFNWSHKCVKNRNIFILKNKFWEKTAHVRLIFNFQNMTMREELYSISNANNKYKTYQYRIVRYVKGPNLNQLPEYEVQKKMQSIKDIPNNLVRIIINDNKKGELRRWQKKSSVTKEFRFGELRFTHKRKNGSYHCSVKGIARLSGPIYYGDGTGRKQDCAFFIMEDKELSDNALVVLGAKAKGGIYDFDFSNNSGVYMHFAQWEGNEKPRWASFPFEIIYD